MHTRYLPSPSTAVRKGVTYPSVCYLAKRTRRTRRVKSASARSGIAMESDEQARLASAARLALADAEKRWRRELGAAAEERNRLRAEIKKLQAARGGTSVSPLPGGERTSPAAKRARLSGGGRKDIENDVPPAPLDHALSRTELYARYHVAEAGWREEADKVATLERSLAS